MENNDVLTNAEIEAIMIEARIARDQDMWRYIGTGFRSLSRVAKRVYAFLSREQDLRNIHIPTN